jgi:septal ring factor EnvC (AmiA/AmiB activator)
MKCIKFMRNYIELLSRRILSSLRSTNLVKAKDAEIEQANVKIEEKTQRATSTLEELERCRAEIKRTDEEMRNIRGKCKEMEAKRKMADDIEA